MLLHLIGAEQLRSERRLFVSVLTVRAGSREDATRNWISAPEIVVLLAFNVACCTDKEFEASRPFSLYHDAAGLQPHRLFVRRRI